MPWESESCRVVSIQRQSVPTSTLQSRGPRPLVLKEILRTIQSKLLLLYREEETAPPEINIYTSELRTPCDGRDGDGAVHFATENSILGMANNE